MALYTSPSLVFLLLLPGVSLSVYGLLTTILRGDLGTSGSPLTWDLFSQLLSCSESLRLRNPNVGTRHPLS